MKKFLNPSRLRLPSVSGNKSGFTLVEILAAITIVGILYLIYTIFFTLSPKPEDLTNKGTVFAAKLASTYTTARQDESLSMDSTAFNDAVTTFAGGKKTIGAMKTACMTNPVFETSGLCASLESVLKIWPNARFEVKPVTFATVQAAYLNDAGTVKLGAETLSTDANAIQICFEQKDAKDAKRKNICGAAFYDAGTKFLFGWANTGYATYP